MASSLEDRNQVRLCLACVFFSPYHMKNRTAHIVTKKTLDFYYNVFFVYSLGSELCPYVPYYCWSDFGLLYFRPL